MRCSIYVLAFGSAGAGVNLETGVVGVRLARQQRLDLVGIGAVGEGSQTREPFVDGGLIVLGLAKLDELDRVRHFLADLAHRTDRGLQPATLAHQAFGLLGIVPQRRVLDTRVELVEPAHGPIPVEIPAHQRQCRLDSVDIGLAFGTHRRMNSQDYGASISGARGVVKRARRDWPHSAGARPDRRCRRRRKAGSGGQPRPLPPSSA
jgi:hypothetical protein